MFETYGTPDISTKDFNKLSGNKCVYIMGARAISSIGHLPIYKQYDRTYLSADRICESNIHA